MYNRYIPQSDGSFQRSRLPDQPSVPASPRFSPAPPPEHPDPVSAAPVCEPPQRRPAPQMRHRPVRQPQPRKESTQDGGVLSFLRQLLPRDFDTADLLVVLLLLLMSGDCGDDPNSALLTLALYLFL